jgi:hypothetical protein
MSPPHGSLASVLEIAEKTKNKRCNADNDSHRMEKLKNILHFSAWLSHNFMRNFNHLFLVKRTWVSFHFN